MAESKASTLIPKEAKEEPRAPETTVRKDGSIAVQSVNIITGVKSESLLKKELIGLYDILGMYLELTKLEA